MNEKVTVQTKPSKLVKFLLRLGLWTKNTSVGVGVTLDNKSQPIQVILYDQDSYEKSGGKSITFFSGTQLSIEQAKHHLGAVQHAIDQAEAYIK